MANQSSQDSKTIHEGIDRDFLIKSVMAYNNIQTLLNEAIEKKNIPVIVSNISRLNEMLKFYLKTAEKLDANIYYYKSCNRSLEIENEALKRENFLLMVENKGREPYRRAKEMLDDYFNDK